MPKVSPLDASQMAQEIQRFIASAREPVFVEPGGQAVALDMERLAVEPVPHGVRLTAWDEGSSLRRRVIAVRPAGPGRLEVTIEKFGGSHARALLADRARPLLHGLARNAKRHAFADQFRRFLTRQFPRWRIADCTTHADLEHSLSPLYPRAFIARGATGWAAIAAPPGDGADGVLTYGLIWHDYLRRRERRIHVEGLTVFLPEGRENTTCLRALCLNPKGLKVSLFRYDERCWEEGLETVAGNLRTRLEPASAPPPDSRWAPDGRERWLEDTIRSAPQNYDARLLSRPVYGQVPAVAGVERGIIDLLACEYDGRLCVLELKASEDPHLPLQAIDYWMRVRWHAERLEFAGAGYFPGIELRAEPPRLLLAAPSLAFHPTTETILGYLDPAIDVERIGLAVEWGREARVSFRLPGARRPC